MTTEEKKKELQNIIQSADEGLTNVLMEAAAEYQVASKEEFVLSKEYIVELERRSADLRSGKVKGYTYEETIEMAKKILKEKYNVIYNPIDFRSEA